VSIHFEPAEIWVKNSTWCFFLLIIRQISTNKYFPVFLIHPQYLGLYCINVAKSDIMHLTLSVRNTRSPNSSAYLLLKWLSGLSSKAQVSGVELRGFRWFRGDSLPLHYQLLAYLISTRQHSQLLYPQPYAYAPSVVYTHVSPLRWALISFSFLFPVLTVGRQSLCNSHSLCPHPSDWTLYCKDGPCYSLGNGLHDRFHAPPKPRLAHPRAVFVRARLCTCLPHCTAFISLSSPRVPHSSCAQNPHLDSTQNARSSPVSAAAQALGSSKHRWPMPLVRAVTLPRALMARLEQGVWRIWFVELTFWLEA
jgi:hypothetical protein